MQSTRILMTLSAAWLLLASFAVAFAPAALLESLGIAVEPSMLPFLKLLGAAFLAFAIMNWMARGSMIGGIYARPLSVGNFLYFAIGTLSLLKPLVEGLLPPALIIASVIQAAFALAFGWLVFGQGAACVGSGGESD